MSQKGTRGPVTYFGLIVFEPQSQELLGLAHVLIIAARRAVFDFFCESEDLL